jgi:SAM-dependent methyltransferase/glycosyltransferase involved in cell wall biosynthesis
MDAPFLSLILPTRLRVHQLTQFLASVIAKTRALNELEVVLVVDEDDSASINHSVDARLRIVRKVVPSGRTMGQLNTAGYEASTGKNLMLVNDDLVIETEGWDEQVFTAIRNHPDGVFLVHVDDGIFHDKLCTFPLVSRAYCELAGGVCPPDYRRYRIDDHIYNVFNLLSVLGKNRILYLPDVRFNHHNFVHSSGGEIEYQPDPVIHRHDTELFDAAMGRRKELAISLLDSIERYQCAERSRLRKERLEPFTNAVALRKPEYVRTVASYSRPNSKADRVTVGVVSADMTGEHARACIKALKMFTTNFELLVVDNNRSSVFNHSVEMNRLLDRCRTDYLVLLDDDVIVHAGWLDRMLDAMGPTTGVVTPAHQDVSGRVSYTGVVMLPDGSGNHGHSLGVHPSPRRIQTMCSAALIVDLAKCGSIRFDERYSKYFLDIDYGLRVWESGYEVLCAPSAMVTHIGGATLTQGSTRSNELFETQRREFVRKWMATGRYDAIAWTRWQAVTEIAAILELPGALQALMERPPTQPLEVFLERTHRLFDSIRDIPDVSRWVARRIWDAVGKQRPTLNDRDTWHLGCLLAFADHPLVMEAGRDGFNLVLCGGEYFALPMAAGHVDVRALRDSSDPSILRATRLDVLRALVAANGSFKVTSGAAHAEIAEVPASDSANRDSTRWLQRSPLKRVAVVDGYDIFSFEFKLFALPDGEGPFDYRRYLSGGYPHCVLGHSIAEIRQKIAARKGDDRILVLTRQWPPSLRQAVSRLLSNGHGAHLSIASASDIPIEWNERVSRLDVGCSPADMIRALESDTPGPIVERLKAEGFTRVMLSWDEPGALHSGALEQAAARIAATVDVVFADGVSRAYSGEDAHRVGYNTAYLASLFASTPRPSGRDVLEIGCSDGLVCDMMLHLGARRVTGIDVMETAGCGYRGESIEYLAMDATRLSFRDASFDLAYSIATFEHLPRPRKTLEEMVRVLRVGGVGYVQAGPLYYSPFGHHMFAYFGDEPWIHLRLSKEAIRCLAIERGIGGRIADDFGLTIDEYLDQMLSPDHINGLALAQYGLDAFRRRTDIEVLKFNVSQEGADLLTPALLRAIGQVPRESLTQHGFEMLFRRLE